MRERERGRRGREGEGERVKATEEFRERAIDGHKTKTYSVNNGTWSAHMFDGRKRLQTSDEQWVGFRGLGGLGWGGWVGWGGGVLQSGLGWWRLGFSKSEHQMNCHFCDYSCDLSDFLILLLLSIHGACDLSGSLPWSLLSIHGTRDLSGSLLCSLLWFNSACDLNGFPSIILMNFIAPVIFRVLVRSVADFVIKIGNDIWEWNPHFIFRCGEQIKSLFEKMSKFEGSSRSIGEQSCGDWDCQQGSRVVMTETFEIK